MRLLPASLLFAVGATFVGAQHPFLISDLSFGHDGRISPDGTQSIPRFALQGNPNLPEVLSNKLILTPPAPGNQRGAVWSDQRLAYSTWTADVDFRANGQEGGRGNLNIWLVREGSHGVGSNSIYTVGNFDGMAIVVDQHGGSGGMIRGFLNDGSTDFRTHHAVDSLAFGHCSYAYRNLGRPSQIKMRQTASSFKVEVDGHLCFETDQLQIPQGYGFGITAASPENPDSFELFKLVVMTEGQVQGGGGQQQQQQADEAQNKPDRPHMRFGRGGMISQEKHEARQKIDEDPYDDAIPDEEATHYATSREQFEDLHDRIQSLNHHLSTLFRQVSGQASAGEQRHAELSGMIADLRGVMRAVDRIDAVGDRVTTLEREVRLLRTELGRNVRDSEHAIKGFVSDTHDTLKERIEYHAPSHTKLYLVIIGSQVLLIGGYVLYKRRKSSPKKYL